MGEKEKKGQEEWRHTTVIIQLFTSPQYKFPPQGDLQGMTNYLHTTTCKRMGGFPNGSWVSIKYFRKSINSKKESVRKQPSRVRHSDWKYGSVSRISGYSEMNELFTAARPAETALLWKKPYWIIPFLAHQQKCQRRFGCQNLQYLNDAKGWANALVFLILR